MGRYPKVTIPPQKEEIIPTPDEVISSVNEGIDALFTVDTTPDTFIGNVKPEKQRERKNIQLFCEQETCKQRENYKEGSTIIWACLRCKHLGVEFV